MADSDIAIVGLNAIGGQSQIVLSWGVDDPNLFKLPYLRFQKAEIRSSLSPDMASPVSLGFASTAIVDLPVPRGELRYYQARAVNLSGQVGDWSAVVSSREISGDISIGTPGYWRHPSGLKLMWGVAFTDSSGNATANISLDGLSFGIFGFSAIPSHGDGAIGPNFPGLQTWSCTVKEILIIGASWNVVFQLRKLTFSGIEGNVVAANQLNIARAPAGVGVSWMAIGG